MIQNHFYEGSEATMDVIVKCDQSQLLRVKVVSVSEVFEQLKVVLDQKFILSYNGINLSQYSSVSGSIVILNLRFPLLGGKGGFGKILKSQGTKMSKRKNISKDNYKTIDGVRLKDMKRLEKLQLAVKTMDDSQEAQKKKLQAVIDRYEISLNAKFDDDAFLRDCEDAMKGVKDMLDTESETETDTESDIENDGGKESASDSEKVEEDQNVTRETPADSKKKAIQCIAFFDE